MADPEVTPRRSQFSIDIVYGLVSIAGFAYLASVEMDARIADEVEAQVASEIEDRSTRSWRTPSSGSTRSRAPAQTARPDQASGSGSVVAEARSAA